MNELAFTPDEILKSMGKNFQGESSQLENQPDKRSWLDKAGDFSEKWINKPIERAGLPNLAASLLSTPQRLTENVANTPAALSELVGGPNIPKFHFPDSLVPAKAQGLGHSPTQNAMGQLGELIGDIASGNKVFKGINQAAGISNEAPLLAKLGSGFLSGSLIGDSEASGGKLLSGVLGAGAAGIGNLSKSGIAQNAASLLTKNEKKYNALYNKILSEGEKIKNKSSLHVPEGLKNKSEGVQAIYDMAEFKDRASLNRFLRNPTLQNAHDAQSDLGKIRRKLEVELKSNKADPSTTGRAIQAAKDLQKRIRGSIQQHFAHGNRNDLATEYGKTTRGYAKEVAPLLGKDIKGYRAGTEKARDVANALIQSKDFSKSELAKLIPGYGLRRSVHEAHPLLKGAAAVGAVAGLEELIRAGIPIPYFLRKLVEQQQ